MASRLSTFLLRAGIATVLMLPTISRSEEKVALQPDPTSPGAPGGADNCTKGSCGGWGCSYHGVDCSCAACDPDPSSSTRCESRQDSCNVTKPDQAETFVTIPTCMECVTVSAELRWTPGTSRNAGDDESLIYWRKTR